MTPLDRYLKVEITEHFSRHNIYITDDDISKIILRVKCGEYAFQIIYGNISNHDVQLPSCIQYKMKLLKPLDDSLLDYAVEYWTYRRNSVISNCYSLDEILLFDRNEIRDIKLKSEFNI